MTICLSSCETVQGSCDLIPLPEYSAAFTARFAEQYGMIMANSPVDTYIIDARALRGAVRACQGK